MSVAKKQEVDRKGAVHHTARSASLYPLPPVGPHHQNILHLVKTTSPAKDQVFKHMNLGGGGGGGWAFHIQITCYSKEMADSFSDTSSMGTQLSLKLQLHYRFKIAQMCKYSI